MGELKNIEVGTINNYSGKNIYCYIRIYNK